MLHAPGDLRLAWWLVGGIVFLYVASFALFYPAVATNTDEAEYLRQTLLLLEGRSTVVNENPLTGDRVDHTPGTYSIGTPMAMAPFARAFGWRGAYVVPLNGLALAVLFTARWLQESGRSPLYALLVLGFPPSLAMGRVAMSDAPSMGAVALGLWLFWRGQEHGWISWLGAGFVAGASMALRFTNALVFLPLFAGTVLRRETRCWALVAGGLAGLGVRALAMQYFFGDPTFERATYYFEPDTLGERLPLFLLGLTVLIPGGLLIAFAYRGPRWPEIVATLAAFFALYALQRFSTEETSFLKRIVLGLRYFMPLVPVIAFAMAEPLQRAWEALATDRPAAVRRRLEAAAATLLVAWIAGVGLASAAVHPLYAGWSARQAELRDAIHAHATLDLPLVTNLPATRKFLRDLDRRFLPIDIGRVSTREAETLLDRHGGFTVVILGRSDSEFWRGQLRRHEAFLEQLDVPIELVYDERVTATDRLRIWRAPASSRRLPGGPEAGRPAGEPGGGPGAPGRASSVR